MPCGGQTPLNEEDAECVWEALKLARKNGMEYEWLIFYSGGLVSGQDPKDAAYLAAVEWDIG